MTDVEQHHAPRRRSAASRPEPGLRRRPPRAISPARRARRRSRRPSCSFTAPGTAAGAGGASRTCWRSQGPQGVRAVADRASATARICSARTSFSTPTSPTSSTCSNGRTSRTSAWSRIPMAAGRSSGALEQIDDRVSSIVWLDAFKPENGQKGIDYASDFSRKAMEEAVAQGRAGPHGADGRRVRRQREGPRLGRPPS